MNPSKAFVFAHHDSAGLLRQNTRQLLERLSKEGHVVLVSTNLTTEEANSAPANINIITRENVGYDFYSYKIGLESLKNPEKYTHVCILNSSFISFDPDQLVAKFLSRLDASIDALGLTFSREISPHLQSFFIAFSRHLFLSNPFSDWWQAIEPISDRQTVILKYELGLSSFLLANGFSLGSAYEPTPMSKCRALCHAIRIGMHQPEFLPFSKVMIDLNQADHLNPTHFAWEELLDQFAIVKRELVEKNPHRFDLSHLYDSYGKKLLDITW